MTALIPVHDYVPEFLHESMASLQGQTCGSWRALVLVEESRRPVFEQELATELTDPRVDMVTNEGRRLAGAFNTGMRHARTEFVAELLADDMWSPDAVEVLDRSIRAHPGVDFFHSSRRIVDADGSSISSVHPAREGVTLADFATTSPVKHLLCWRRTMGLAVGGMDEASQSVGPDDFDFPWVMAEHGAQFGAVQECLYVHRDHREHFRLTTHLPRSVHRRELTRIFRKHGLSRAEARRRIRSANRSYLRQCLYGSNLEQQVREKLRLAPRRPWRERYR